MHSVNPGYCCPVTACTGLAPNRWPLSTVGSRGCAIYDDNYAGYRKNIGRSGARARGGRNRVCHVDPGRARCSRQWIMHRSRRSTAIARMPLFDFAGGRCKGNAIASGTPAWWPAMPRTAIRCMARTREDPGAFWRMLRPFATELRGRVFRPSEYRLAIVLHFSSRPPTDKIDLDQRVVGELGYTDTGSGRQAMRREITPIDLVHG